MPLYLRFDGISDEEKYTSERIAEDVKKRIEAMLAGPSVKLEEVTLR
jgi:hypothetical protein